MLIFGGKVKGRIIPYKMFQNKMASNFFNKFSNNANFLIISQFNTQSGKWVIGAENLCNCYKEINFTKKKNINMGPPFGTSLI